MFHARDEHGNIKIRPKPRQGQPRRDEREQWVWERRNILGWPEWYIRQELKEWDRIYAEQEAKRKAAREARIKGKGRDGGNRKKSNRRS